jgi:hypothetical protein
LPHRGRVKSERWWQTKHGSISRDHDAAEPKTREMR